ncbi:signal peptidase II [Kineococcus aurantiacus]|uniref:Lipoprotein signal peptidase n=1 Tax=Kineococcus aurantiacus TaxID=37633 RepID=A0A7Y9ASJ6_9ACTN|nr:signal peptidase II [Kineococcus aurantiacus]NYD21022.1 signal peptidase II [Kineococcus aurantiacus]
MSEADTSPPRSRRALWTLCVWAVVYVLDQVTKVLAVAHLTEGRPQPFVGELLQFHLIRNPGAAFSFATGFTWVFTLLAAVVVVVVVRMSRKLRSLPWALAFGFLLAGATGNLTDRLLREPGFARGHVVDFLQLPRWPIFNVADASICVAAVLIAVLAVRGVGLDGRREVRGARSGAESA